MLRLHGFPTSNYHNLVKLALLEKGLDFEEVLVYPPADADFREKSPRGKYPCLETEHGFLSESMVILEYLEDRGEGTPLLPADAYARAKVRELCRMNELYLELVARRLLPKMLYGAEVSAEIHEQVRAELRHGVSAVKRLVHFEPFVLGDELTLADVSAICHWPVVRLVARKLLSENPLERAPGFEAYLEAMESRPHVQRIRADAKEDSPRFFERIRQAMEGRG